MPLTPFLAALDEHVADVVAIGQADPAGALPGPGYRLPAFCSSFVGRPAEIDEVTALLGSARLVTLTGTGGSGKTRLAVEVAERVAGRWAFFVDLARLRDEALVAEEIASAYALGELRGRPLAPALAGKVTGAVLLVLDNCEHLIGACGTLATELLQGCRGLQILTTTQQRLGVSGEVVWRVPPLSLPQPGPDLVVDGVVRAASAQLFCERATAVKREFVASAANVMDIVEICQRLDGNPLAIELAAARVDVLAPAEIAARLHRRFDLLIGPPSGPARHQTLTAALEWSHDLLGQSERVLLRRLSVFAGGFDLDAAETVCAGDGVDRRRVLDLLAALVAKSLVVADTGRGVARYRLLETVRYYAAGELATAEEVAQTAQQHARWCLGLVERATECEHEDEALRARVAEQDNIRIALQRSLDEGWVELALRLAAGQMGFWQQSGRFAEAEEWLGRVLAASEGAPPARRAVTWRDAGFAAFLLGRRDAARARLSTSIDLWRQAGEPAEVQRTEGLLRVVAMFGGDPDGVEDLESHLQEVRQDGSDTSLLPTLLACAQARLFRSEPLAAQRHFGELLSVARCCGDRSMVTNALVGLGAAAVGLGDYAAADLHLREGAALAADTAETHVHTVATAWLAELARLRGDAARARAEFERCLAASRAFGAPYPLAEALVGLGRVLLAQDEAEAARALFAEAAVLGEAGQSHILAPALDALGEVASTLGEPSIARTRYEDALAAAARRGDEATTARATYHMAELTRDEGAITQAASLHHDALRRRHELGDRAGLADSLEAVAGICVVKGDHDMAARLFGAADALRDAGGVARQPRRTGTYETDIAMLAQQMPSSARERAWAQGAALTGNQAVAYATKGRGPRARPAAGPDSLTPAERDVVAFAAQGMTRAEIAERLFVSPRTVQSHLRSVYAKLDVSSRRELRQRLSEA